MNRSLALTCLLVTASTAAAGDKPAELPGVPAAVVELSKEGFGTASKGGEGGRVIWVTNRNPKGEGSFTEALQAEEPRIIKFKVGGVIKHDDMVRTKNSGKCSRVTIDGLSAAAYGGITIEGGIFFIACEDVIVRHVRIRHARGGSGNCINMNGCKRVLIDHVSMSWATDQVFGALACEDVTYQWCIAAEGLIECDHPKGPHSCGCLISDRNFTLHHCLFTGNQGRNPLWHEEYRTPQGQKRLQEYKQTGKLTPCYFDIVNNTFYNCGHGGQTYGATYTNFVGNYYRAGPDTPAWQREILFLTKGCQGAYADFPEPKIYCKDNIGSHRPKSDMDEFSMLWLQGVNSDGTTSAVRTTAGVFGVAHPSLERYVARKPFDVPAVKTEPVLEAYAKVLQYVGAFPRDKTDERLIWEVLEKKGVLGAKGMFAPAEPAGGGRQSR